MHYDETGEEMFWILKYRKLELRISDDANNGISGSIKFNCESSKCVFLDMLRRKNVLWFLFLFRDDGMFLHSPKKTATKVSIYFFYIKIQCKVGAVQCRITWDIVDIHEQKSSVNLKKWRQFV